MAVSNNATYLNMKPTDEIRAGVTKRVLHVMMLYTGPGRRFANKAEFARMIDVSKQDFRRIEIGERFITVQILYHLHAHLSVDLNWLVSGKGKSPK